MKSLIFAFSTVAFLCAMAAATLGVDACTNTSNDTCCYPPGTTNAVTWNTSASGDNPFTADGNDHFETVWQLDFCTTSDLGAGSFVESNASNVTGQDVTPDTWTPGDCSGHHCCTIEGDITASQGTLDILGYVGNPTYPFSDTDTLTVNEA